MAAPTIGLVISTMNAGIHKLNTLLTPSWDSIVVVHQITDGREQEYHAQHALYRSQGVHVIVQHQPGLSYSRNTGLDAMTADYALITDDDVQFPAHVITRLHEAIAALPGSDIITLRVSTPEGVPFKKYADYVFRHTRRSVARVSSIEMLVSVSWWRNVNIRFNTHFGLGAMFATGEEYVFMTAAIRADSRAWYFPATVALHPIVSSGKILDATQLSNKGAMISCVHGMFALPFIIGFALRKHALYRQQFSFFTAMRHMHNGIKKYQAL